MRCFYRRSSPIAWKLTDAGATVRVIQAICADWTKRASRVQVGGGGKAQSDPAQKPLYGLIHRELCHIAAGQDADNRAHLPCYPGGLQCSTRCGPLSTSAAPSCALPGRARNATVPSSMAMA